MGFQLIDCCNPIIKFLHITSNPLGDKGVPPLPKTKFSYTYLWYRIFFACFMIVASSFACEVWNKSQMQSPNNSLVSL